MPSTLLQGYCAALCCVWLLVVGGAFNQCHAGNYMLSAHANNSYGVKRPDLVPYAQGNCAHCHEQHRSIDGDEPDPYAGEASPFALFAGGFNQTMTTGPYRQDDEFCFFCHADLAQSIQDNASGELLSYDFARTFGGAPQGPDNLLDTFNQAGIGSGSNHNLLAVQRYAAANFDWFSEQSDPCTACHNPHLVRRNKANPADPTFSAIARPSQHEQPWGDGSDERMNSYANRHGGNYRAPRYWDSTSLYEPAASSDNLGSLLPDYNSFCLDCHDSTTANVTSYNRSTILKGINWDNGSGNTPFAADKHGSNGAVIELDTRAPYVGVTNVILACSDCHEPHGSSAAVLLRRTINGEAVIDDQWGNQCRQCHMDDLKLHEVYPTYGGPTKQNSWKGVHHGHANSIDNPYQTWQANATNGCATCHVISGNQKLKIPCQDCHGHGKFISGSSSITVSTGRTIPPPWDGIDRRTF